MAVYMDEEDVWKCPQHPSRRRRTGICHVCLRERLSSLCPDCANVRPCACYAASSTSSSSGCSSSSSASFSRYSSAAGVGSVGRVSSLIDNEPAFRRSRSLALPFLRSKPPPPSSSATADAAGKLSSRSSTAAAAFWSLFGRSRSSRYEAEPHRAVVLLEEEAGAGKSAGEEERKRMMRKSRSVAVTSGARGSDVSRPSWSSSSSSSKGKAWYFPSPIKAFRQSISKGIMVQERSPLYRG
ncbi:hypothetical protein Tsubulata_011778 [Turnera subulata]|uniref:Uncharacterized protein n=1 Tax=Turnera subulata TaxID=218843 RepID=A0A9Q0GFX2_9ROSI|nr:hypothetical protein Tsubulata_011778 [Turnera subulata]